jgi:hypothetical protein
MLTKRKIRHWEAVVRQQANDNARALAVAIATGTAWMPPPYDLGILLEPGEIAWHRCPATYRWRGTDSWIEQRSSHGGRRAISREVTTPCMYSLGNTDWLVTNLRLAARSHDGQVISVYWSAIVGLTVDLDAGMVAIDGADGYHGELSGPALASIAVAAVAVCHGRRALVEHPGLGSLRGGVPVRSGRRPRLAWPHAVAGDERLRPST